jgi:galactonate dehydratase
MHYNAGPFDLLTYITNPDVFKVQTGMISLLEGPGLGIDVNEDMIRNEDAHYRAGKVNAWRNPICKHSFPRGVIQT